MDLIMTLELIPQLEPIPTWNRLHQWLFWPMELLWNRLQKNWNRNISNTYGSFRWWCWLLPPPPPPLDLCRKRSQWEISWADYRRLPFLLHSNSSPPLIHPLPCCLLLLWHASRGDSSILVYKLGHQVRSGNITPRLICWFTLGIGIHVQRRQRMVCGCEKFLPAVA